MWWWIVIPLAGVLWAAAALAGWLAETRSPRPGDFTAGLVWVVILLYARIVHRLRVERRDLLPRAIPDAGLIVVANHTGGVDPVLIQAACRFEVRWVMAEDMRARSLESLWSLARVIFVRRDGGASPGFREAIRHVKRGGAIGLFPEGRIERRRGHVGAFQSGVGALWAATRAPVLLVAIEGTPEASTAWGSLWRPSRARVRFVALEPFPESEGARPDAAALGERLEQRLAAGAGWRLVGEGP